MEDFLPLVVIVIAIIGAVTSVKNKKKQPGKHTTGENFPFPWLEELMGERVGNTPEAEPVLADEMVVEEGASAVVVGVGSVEGERSTDVERAVSIHAEQQISRLPSRDERNNEKFDLEQAVVYSAILNPKFDDDIF